MYCVFLGGIGVCCCVVVCYECDWCVCGCLSVCEWLCVCLWCVCGDCVM